MHTTARFNAKTSKLFLLLTTCNILWLSSGLHSTKKTYGKSLNDKSYFHPKQ